MNDWSRIALNTIYLVIKSFQYPSKTCSANYQFLQQNDHDFGKGTTKLSGEDIY